MNGGLIKAAGHGAIAALAGLLLSTGSAFAADLGGNCCADLEERVAELEATTARKGNRRVSLVISGQVNRAVMFWDQGHQDGIYSVDNSVTRSGFNFDGSARINPNLTAGFQLVIGLSVGARSHQVSQVDDDGFPANPAQPAKSSSQAVTGFAGGDGVLGLELANWYLDHKQYGRLTVGRINTASAGTTIVDLGGAGVIANANFGAWNSNMLLSSDGAFVGIPGIGNGAATWNTLMGGNFVSFSSLSRAEGVSYTSPTMHGFSFQAAFGEGRGSSDQNGEWDVALRYAGEFSGFRFAAAAAYCVNCGFTQDISDGGNGAPFISIAGTTTQNESADVRKLQGSASLLHVASGLYLSGALGNVEYRGNTAGERIQLTGFGLTTGDQRPDTLFWYLNGGISKNWTGMGNTVLYGEYGQVDDGATGLPGSSNSLQGGCSVATVLPPTCIVGSSQMHFWGIGVVQNIDAAAMELFLSYRLYDGEASRIDDPLVGPNTKTNVNLDSLGVVMSGARIRF